MFLAVGFIRPLGFKTLHQELIDSHTFMRRFFFLSFYIFLFLLCSWLWILCALRASKSYARNSPIHTLSCVAMLLWKWFTGDPRPMVFFHRYYLSHVGWKRPDQNNILNKKIKKTPFGVFFIFLISNFLSSQAVSSQVLSAFTSLTTVFGMGTGGSS